MQYWNPFAEQLSREKISKIQLKNLKKLLQHAQQNTPFYKERYTDIQPDNIRSMADVKNLPLIDKEDLRTAQEDQNPFPFGKMQGVPFEAVTTFRQSSGTTGRPVFVHESYESWQWRVVVWCHILWVAGFRAECLSISIIPTKRVHIAGTKKIMWPKATALKAWMHPIKRLWTKILYCQNSVR